jgi:outer membrane receptor protein involved in Fe transport
MRSWFRCTVAATVFVAGLGPVVADEEFDFLFTEEAAETSADDSASAAESASVSDDSESVDASDTEESAANTSASNQASAASKRPVIEEVIVTSQKRAENIRDVPISVSALDGEALKTNNIANMNDLSLYTPNVKFQVTPNSTFINIRGLGTGENRGFEQSVGLVIDGVYYGRGDFMLGGTLDMSRIEVLRGPQGTLFGKNTIAGALNIATGQPENEFHGDVDAMTGDFNHQRYRGAITGPLTDTLSWRLAFQDETRDGYIFNTAVDEFHANLDNQMARAKLLWEPTDNFSATLGFDVNEVSQRGDGYQISHVVGDHLEVYQSADPEAEADGNNFQASTDDERSGGTREISGQTLNLSWDIGDYNLTAITGLADMDVRQDVDADFSAHRFLFLGYLDTYEQFSQELRLTSPPGDIEYVAGLYYFRSRFKVNTSIESYADGAPIFLGPAFGAPAAASGILSGPLGGIVGTLTGPIIDDASRKSFDQTATAWAGFGQATWYVTDRWSLIGGLRYGKETKDVDMKLTFDNTGLLYSQILGEAPYDVQDSRTETDFSPKFSTKFDFNDDINVYATYAEGFKSGGFNAQAPTDENIQFEPEEATTYELGSKMRLLDGAMTLNIGLFSTDFNNLQVTIFNGTQFIVGNAATARTQGFEFDGMWLPFENAMMTFSGGFTDATYVSYPDGPCWADGDGEAGPNPRERSEPIESTPDPTDSQCFQDLSGEPLTRAPKWNGSLGFDYGFSVPNLSWRLITGLNFLYQSETFLNLDNDPLDLQEATTQINAKIGVAGRDEDWFFTIHGRNLTDEIVYLEAADVPLLEGDHFNRQDLPRTISAEFRLLW